MRVNRKVRTTVTVLKKIKSPTGDLHP